MTPWKRHPRFSRGASHRGRLATVAVAGPLLAVVAVLTATVVTLAQSRPKTFSLPMPDSSNFMNFQQITKDNVDELEVAWFYPYASDEFTPVMANGVLYGFGRDNALVALDAASGKEIWIHEGLNGINSCSWSV